MDNFVFDNYTKIIFGKKRRKKPSAKKSRNTAVKFYSTMGAEV